MAATSKRPIEIMVDAAIFLAVFCLMMGAGVLAGLVLLLCGVSVAAALMVLLTCGVLGVVAGISAAYPRVNWSVTDACERATALVRAALAARRSAGGPSHGWGSYGTRVARNIASRRFRFLG